MSAKSSAAPDEVHDLDGVTIARRRARMLGAGHEWMQGKLSALHYMDMATKHR